MSTEEKTIEEQLADPELFPRLSRDMDRYPEETGPDDWKGLDDPRIDFASNRHRLAPPMFMLSQGEAQAAAHYYGVQVFHPRYDANLVDHVYCNFVGVRPPAELKDLYTPLVMTATQRSRFMQTGHWYSDEDYPQPLKDNKK